MYTEEELIDELHRVAEELGKVPTKREMERSDGPNPNTYNRRLGSWNDALECVGFDTYNECPSYTESDLIDELRRVTEELGKVPTSRKMDELDGPSLKPYRNHFGSWNDALTAAGFDPRLEFRSSDELIDEFQRVVEGLGKVPTQKEMRESNGPSPITFRNHFGSWNEAVREAGYEPNPWGSLSGEDHPRWEGGYEQYYGPNWYQQRREVRRRDDHTCQATGCDVTEDDIDTELHVHHITPFREFRAEDDNLDYEQANRLENLVTLCPSCHKTLEGQYTSLTANDFKRIARV